MVCFDSWNILEYSRGIKAIKKIGTFFSSFLIYAQRSKIFGINWDSMSGDFYELRRNTRVLESTQENSLYSRRFIKLSFIENEYSRFSCDNETVCSLRSNRGLPIELSHARLFVSRIGDKREEAENRRMILPPPPILFPIYIFDLNSRDIRGNMYYT